MHDLKWKKYNSDYEFRHHTKLIDSTDTQLRKRRERMTVFVPFSLVLDADIRKKKSCLKAEMFLRHWSAINCSSFGFFPFQRRYNFLNKSLNVSIILSVCFILLLSWCLKTEHRNYSCVMRQLKKISLMSLPQV